MTVVAGVDGCRDGWLIVWRAIGPEGVAGAAEVAVCPRWEDLPAADIVAVDMPIGLPESGRRGCDMAARARLGPRRSSVFLDLRRPLLDFADYAAANAWAKADGAGLSKQAWNLLPKIRELDAAMTPEAQERVRETHPELVFARLNGGPMAEAKRKAGGAAARRALLESAGFDRLDDMLAGLDRHLAAPDDLYDACALAWCAGRMAAGRAERLPTDSAPLVDAPLLDAPLVDAKGLRMEIWF